MTITPSSRNDRHLVIFKVAPYTFCAPTGEVERFIMVPPISRLPHAPTAVIGVINHRGQVYRVISLRRKLGLETGPPRMEGQLILTRLPSGLTAFLVDEVVDVLPAARLVRQPLGSHSTMDLFDAFVLRDDQVLFHTSFERMDKAKETPFPNPDLKTMEHLAAGGKTPKLPGGAAPAAGTKGLAAVSTAPEKGVAPTIAPPVNTASKPPTPGLPNEASPPRPAAAIPPASNEPQARPLPPLAKRPKPRRPLRFKTPQRRVRRYALALTAVLVLLLIVVFSSAWLVKGRLRALDRQPNNAQPLSPAAIEKPKPSEPAVTTTVTPLPAETEVHKKDLPPDQNSLSSTPEKKEQASSQPTALPDIQPEKPPRQPLPEATPPQPAPEATSSSSREVLRLETEAFTLMVERPSTKSTGTRPKTPQPVLPAHSEITHVVVAGDTLWDIAAHYLGDPFQYPNLARLSRIHDPDLIFPGDVIRIIMKPSR